MSDDPFPGSAGDFYERIVKLKEELEHLKTSHRAVMFQYLEACSLITELCDVLERVAISLTPQDRELVQRARDAAN